MKLVEDSRRRPGFAFLVLFHFGLTKGPFVEMFFLLGSLSKSKEALKKGLAYPWESIKPIQTHRAIQLRKSDHTY